MGHDYSTCSSESTWIDAAPKIMYFLSSRSVGSLRSGLGWAAGGRGAGGGARPRAGPRRKTKSKTQESHQKRLVTLQHTRLFMFRLKFLWFVDCVFPPRVHIQCASENSSSYLRTAPGPPQRDRRPDRTGRDRAVQRPECRDQVHVLCGPRPHVLKTSRAHDGLPPSPSEGLHLLRR